MILQFRGTGETRFIKFFLIYILFSFVSLLSSKESITKQLIESTLLTNDIQNSVWEIHNFSKTGTAFAMRLEDFV